MVWCKKSSVEPVEDKPSTVHVKVEVTRQTTVKVDVDVEESKIAQAIHDAIQTITKWLDGN